MRRGERRGGWRREEMRVDDVEEVGVEWRVGGEEEGRGEER